MALLRFIPPVKKGLKRLPSGLVEALQTIHFHRTAVDPTLVRPLSSPFKELGSYLMRPKTEHLWDVTRGALIVALMIDPRKRLYERLEQPLRWHRAADSFPPYSA